MPDLGKYAWDVLAAYGITILLVLLIVGFSLRQSVLAKRALDAVESRAKHRGT